MVCTHDGITNIVARWPGSTHDSRILSNSRLLQTLRRLRGAYLVGDKGYACTRYMMTPKRKPITDSDQRYNRAHAQTRNIIECLYGMIKRRFLPLLDPMRTKLQNTFVIIVAIAVLHNKARFMGDSVPDGDRPGNHDSEDEEECDEEDDEDGLVIRQRIIDTLN